MEDELARVRSDALPEDNYEDTGCDWAPSCLSCPFPKCRYDVKVRGGARRQLAHKDDATKVMEMRAKGVKNADIAKATGISMRTLYRIVRGQRDVL